jgi:hypothetical protein
MYPTRSGFADLLVVPLLVLWGIFAWPIHHACSEFYLSLGTAGERRACENVRALKRAQEEYRSRHYQYAPTLAALARENLIDSELGTGIKDGYRFEMVIETGDPDCEKFQTWYSPERGGWIAKAIPLSPSDRIQFGATAWRISLGKGTVVRLEERQIRAGWTLSVQ